ncbi:MAG: BlaI/MecI/CopY family transcriptional regulator [Prevotella sp.]|nr:BlaI/MecI/CopY family transcriptional regulator [Prevotella sp.]
MKDKKKLTESETQVMNALWSLPGEKGYSSEIMSRMPDPKPALTTLLTFLKILKQKGFVESDKKGKSQLFSARISREKYTRVFLHDVKDTFFGGSFTSLVSFYAREEHLSESEIEELIDIIKNKKET